MIISASRRTDIPAYYSDWFCNRIKAGFVLVRNPMNIHQVSKINLAPELVDGIVFWTKNPASILAKLPEFENYMYYFQFTITPYGKDIESNLPSKRDAILVTFKKLSDIIGKDRIVWRYDPIFINEKYSFDYHLHAFEEIANELCNYTRKVTISFIDEEYRAVKANIKEFDVQKFTHSIQYELGAKLAEIAHRFNLSIDTCAEQIDLEPYGVEHARCIDDRLFAKLLACPLNLDKDKTQRLECGCVASIDIGMYNTCSNGCRYCYANYSSKAVSKNFANHNPLSPLISGEVCSDDKITERTVKSCRNPQRKLFI